MTAPSKGGATKVRTYPRETRRWVQHIKIILDADVCYRGNRIAVIKIGPLRSADCWLEGGLVQEITVFDNDQFGQIRAISLDGEPWFVARDVALALGYANTDDAVRRHCKNAKTYPLKTRGQVRHVVIIQEPDVYSLIFGSKLPTAEEFKWWVFQEVLTAIRKTGVYIAPDIDLEELSHQLQGAVNLAKMFGYENNQALLTANKTIKKLRGIDVHELLGVSLRWPLLDDQST